MQLFIIQYINIATFAIIVLFFLYASIISFLEKEKKAAFLFLLTSIFLSLLAIVLIFINPFYTLEILWIIFITITISLLLLFLPIQGSFRIGEDSPKLQFDERDTMFSRKELKPGSERFFDYYNKNKDRKILDDQFREKPGLLSDQATKFELLSFNAANANFDTVSLLKNGITGIVSDEKREINSEQIQKFILNWTKKLGAHSVGIAALEKYHFYHTKGRGETYDKQVENNHKNAVVFTVEMDKEMMDTAPDGPTVLESSQQYLSSGIIAVQIANFIRSLGYEAKAHIDGNYELVCPLVARDAGLGEIGRMGLLMTPKLGPRVRIAAVTTDFPFSIQNIKRLKSTIHFCKICKKCADNCPSKSIEFDDRKQTENGLRWMIDSEACFTYWCITGTDCGKCMRVCPFSHPDNFLHNFIRFGIKNNVLFRYLALKLDDFYYGRRPAKLSPPKWMQ